MKDYKFILFQILEYFYFDGQNVLVRLVLVINDKREEFRVQNLFGQHLFRLHFFSFSIFLLDISVVGRHQTTVGRPLVVVCGMGQTRQRENTRGEIVKGHVIEKWVM